MTQPERRSGPAQRHHLETRVLSNSGERGHHTLWLDAPAIAATALPGQFLVLHRFEPDGSAYRRPFSIFDSDISRGSVAIRYAPRGPFTTALSTVEQGALLTVTGPLGRAFQMPPDATTRLILVAGGAGAAPLHFLAARSDRAADRIVVINAARSLEALVAMEEFGSMPVTLRSATDDLSQNDPAPWRRVLEEVLDEGSPASARIAACGPNRMLAAVAEVAARRAVPCQVSVSAPMPCGIGYCNACSVASSSGVALRACWDGPVMDAKQVDWPRLL
ncbi:MAG: hypothetical protein KGJ62_00665 [Armatimonadetes bacterium]|nr:hypothetical protein [Armatimonadota bacterium]MDE2205145.1 hypothetical protein [Armatimonadota bacterium]